MIDNLYITIFFLIILIVIIIVILHYSVVNINDNIKYDKLSVLSVYQYTEIVVGTLLFFVSYILYMSIIYRTVKKIDLVYSTIAFGLLLTSGNIVDNWVEYNNQ